MKSSATGMVVENLKIKNTYTAISNVYCAIVKMHNP